ncbi:ABC transporter ATP-binding protein [Nocardioides caldifontis]|uniref:ABC transporter ATP-binding protein n=1 Tax=Nocardioides caldifontis TaxID=2588938 RepID=UPI00193AC54B|nr:ABC transporter ATP-binding protein [Nocardioides caldifontis]
MTTTTTNAGNGTTSGQLHAKGAELRLQGVRKSFGDSVAVHGVDLDLRPGEFLTMLGPSGSGKTTTLNMIAGFLEPDSGVVTLSGKDITHTPPHKRDIGMVFQNYALFPHLSALKNVMFPLQMRGVDKKSARRRAELALEMVELSHLAKRLPKQLSGGQQQRVALARAFVFEPGLLLMDEPLGALDKRLRETMQVEIMRVCREVGSTVVYVTHDQDEALTMSDRIAVYNHGYVEQLDTAEGLYERPTTTFVAGFIGDSSMLSCQVRPGGDVVGSGWHTAASARDMEPGKATLVLRPESVTVRADGTGVGGCSVQATVSDVFYLGSHVKYLLRTEAGETVQAHVPRSEAPTPFARGASVVAAWKPEAGIVLAE